PPRRQAAGTPARIPGAARRPPPLRLEEREMGARHRIPHRGPARLLGGARLPQPRQPVAGAALLLPGGPRGRAAAGLSGPAQSSPIQSRSSLPRSRSRSRPKGDVQISIVEPFGASPLGL